MNSKDLWHWNTWKFNLQNFQWCTVRDWFCTNVLLLLQGPFFSHIKQPCSFRKVSIALPVWNMPVLFCQPQAHLIHHGNIDTDIYPSVSMVKDQWIVLHCFMPDFWFCHRFLNILMVKICVEASKMSEPLIWAKNPKSKPNLKIHTGNSQNQTKLETEYLIFKKTPKKPNPPPPNSLWKQKQLRLFSTITDSVKFFLPNHSIFWGLFSCTYSIFLKKEKKLPPKHSPRQSFHQSEIFEVRVIFQTASSSKFTT